MRQFDIVYGRYSSRYVGNSMGGIVNITTKEPEGTEAFATVQGFVQPYRQYGTDRTYPGFPVEAGVGLKQKDGPWSLRVSGRLPQNEGKPQSFYFLTPATGAAAGTAVTGAVIDTDIITRVPTANGVSTTTTRPTGTILANDPAPIFSAQSPAKVTLPQGKLRVGQGAPVREGRVTTLGRTWNATGAVLSRVERRISGWRQGQRPAGPSQGEARALHLPDLEHQNLHVEQLRDRRRARRRHAGGAGADRLVHRRSDARL